jgi:hypothetical protein
MDRDERGERGSGASTLFRNEMTKFFKGAIDPLSRCVLAHIESFSNSRKGMIFEVTQQLDFSIGCFKPMHQLIEHGAEPFPIGIWSGIPK